MLEDFETTIARAEKISEDDILLEAETLAEKKRLRGFRYTKSSSPNFCTNQFDRIDFGLADHRYHLWF